MTVAVTQDPTSPTQWADATAQAVGAQVGRYKTERLLGRGGFGIVFAARDVDLDREVALKLLLPQHTSDAQIMQRFFQEARAAAKIEHPAIVTIHEFGHVRERGSPFEGSAYIAMEMVRGESLSRRLAGVGKLDIDAAVAIGRQVASALSVAHAAGIIHRDLKPDNLMLARDPIAPAGERVKILDFGIAKLGEGAHSKQGVHTTAHVAFGTPLYMSPEQFRSAASVDARTDIYALGCILFELVTGTPPFRGDFVDLLTSHTQGVRPALRKTAPSAPAWLEQLVTSMLSIDITDRPKSMAEVERLLGGTSSRGASPNASLQTPELAAGVATTLGLSAGVSLVEGKSSTSKRSWVVGGFAAAVVCGIALLMVTHSSGGTGATGSGSGEIATAASHPSAEKSAQPQQATAAISPSATPPASPPATPPASAEREMILNRGRAAALGTSIDEAALALAATDALAKGSPDDVEVRVVRATLDLRLGNVDVATREVLDIDLSTADTNALRSLLGRMLAVRPKDPQLLGLANALHLRPNTRPTVTARSATTPQTSPSAPKSSGSVAASATPAPTAAPAAPPAQPSTGAGPPTPAPPTAPTDANGKTIYRGTQGTILTH